MMNDTVALDSIARSLEKIAHELSRLNNSVSLITSLEAEIVLDLRYPQGSRTRQSQRLREDTRAG